MFFAQPARCTILVNLSTITRHSVCPVSVAGWKLPTNQVSELPKVSEEGWVGAQLEMV